MYNFFDFTYEKSFSTSIFGLMGKGELAMRDVHSVAEKADIGGRRLGFDRRKTLIPDYEPERRSGLDRRTGQDRRGRYGQGDISYLRRHMDRYIEFKNTNKGLIYGILLSLLIWAGILFLIMNKW